MTDDYPWVPTLAERTQYIAQLEEEWGWEADMAMMAPNADGRWRGRYGRF